MPAQLGSGLGHRVAGTAGVLWQRDGVADRLDRVAAEVVHYHDIAGREGGDEDALDIGSEDLAVHWAVDDS